MLNIFRKSEVPDPKITVGDKPVEVYREDDGRITKLLFGIKERCEEKDDFKCIGITHQLEGELRKKGFLK